MQILIPLVVQTADLTPWEQRELWEAIRTRDDRRARENSYESCVGTELPGEPRADGLHRHLAQKVMCYEAFPPELVTPQLRRAPVQTGDTVGTLYHAAPGIDLFFASRVVETFDEAAEGGIWRTGFTYSTLQGHPVMGSETFSIEKNLASGEIYVALRSWSQPITALARCFAWPCRALQAQAGRAALSRVGSLAKEFSQR